MPRVRDCGAITSESTIQTMWRCLYCGHALEAQAALKEEVRGMCICRISDLYCDTSFSNSYPLAMPRGWEDFDSNSGECQGEWASLQGRCSLVFRHLCAVICGLLGLGLLQAKAMVELM